MINNKDELKKYLNNNKIQTRWLKNENGKFVDFIENDILIKYIENGASLEIIDFIILHSYGTVNYISFGTEGPLYSSPLSSALKNNRFDIANLLIDYGAEIERIPFETIKKIINMENLEYLKQKNYVVPSQLIHYLITSNANELLNQLFNLFLFNNEFILKLVLCHKNKMTLSNKQLRQIINSVTNKINFNSSFYETAIKKNNYEAFNLLCNYDTRGNEYIIKDICNTLKVDFVNRDIQYVLTTDRNDLKELFLHNVKNSDLKYPMNKPLLNYLEQMTTYAEDKKHIETLISNNLYKEFKEYVEEHRVLLSKFHFQVFNKKYHKYRKRDIIGYSIEACDSIKLINYIIDQCKKEDPNFIQEHLYYLYSALYQNKFKIAEFLLRKLDKADFKLIFTWLRNSKVLNPRNLQFLLSHNIFHYREDSNDVQHIQFSSFLHSMENKYRYPLKKFLQSYIYNNSFILTLLSIYKNRTSLSESKLQEMITNEKNKFNCRSMYALALQDHDFEEMNTLYNYDTREKQTILKDIFNILIKMDNEVTNQFCNKIMDGTLKLPVDELYLSHLRNGELIRQTVLEKINNNQVNELNDFLTSHNFSLTYFNNPFNEDLLTSMIKNDGTTPEMIKFIIKQYTSLNYAVYSDNESPINDLQLNNSSSSSFSSPNIPYSPLSLSLAFNKFNIAKMLMDHGADINYRWKGYNNNENYQIFNNLHQMKQLNSSNLKFLINYGYTFTSEDIQLFITNKTKNTKRKRNQYSTNDRDHDTNDSIDRKEKEEKQTKKCLKIILENYVWDNQFILKLIHISKNRLAHSNAQFHSLILHEKNKIVLTKSLVDEALYHSDDEFLELLFNYDISSPTYLYTESKELYPFITNENSNFLQYLFDHELIDFTKNISLEPFLIKFLPWDDEFELASDDSYPDFAERKNDKNRYLGLNHFDHFKLFLERYINIKLQETSETSETTATTIPPLENENMTKIILRLYQKLCMRANDNEQFTKGMDFINLLLEKLLYHKTFYFSHYESSLLKLFDFEFQVLYIKKSLLHKNFNLNNVNIKSVLLYLKKLDEDLILFNYFAEELLNDDTVQDKINAKDILNFVHKVQESLK